MEQINAAGGVTVGATKLPIELVLQDDESDATKTVARLEGLAAQGVVGYLGGFGSDLHAAAASVAEKNRVPYLGVAFALQKIHQQGFRYLFSPFWKSPDIGQATQGLLGLIPAAERPKTVAIFQEKTDWGREMAAAWTEAGKSRRLPGGGHRRVRAGRQGLLRHHPEGPDRERGRGAGPAHPARRHDDREADEGARLHARSSRFFIRAPDAPDLVAEPRQGRRLHGARGGLAPRDEGRRREGAERRAPEEVRPPRRSAGGPGLRVRADPGRRGHARGRRRTGRRSATRSRPPA